MTSLEFIYKEIPHTRGSVDKCINITPNEICTLLDKYVATKVENSEDVSNMPDFDKIVESKVAQYGHTKAAYQFAAEEYVILYRDSVVNESSMLPGINSNTFKNYLEIKGYEETLNPLVYKKQGFEYDKEVLHRHFINEIEFGD